MANSSDSKRLGNDVEIKDPTSGMGIIAPVQSSQDIELVAFDEAASETVKVRSKLRLTAIMMGLYVRALSSHPAPQLTPKTSWQCSS
jgi:hypothetical protein